MAAGQQIHIVATYQGYVDMGKMSFNMDINAVQLVALFVSHCPLFTDTH